MKNILLAAFFGFFLLPACKEPVKKPKQTVTDDYKKRASESRPDQKTGNGDYSISASKGWTKSDTIMMGERVVFIQSPREGAGDDFIENVNVITEKVGNMDMEEYLDRSISALEKGLKSYDQEKISDRSINGLEFKCIRYSHDYAGNLIDVDVYLTLHNSMAYIITCSAKGGTIFRWEPEFEEIIRSFKLN